MLEVQHALEAATRQIWLRAALGGQAGVDDRCVDHTQHHLISLWRTFRHVPRWRKVSASRFRGSERHLLDALLVRGHQRNNWI